MFSLTDWTSHAAVWDPYVGLPLVTQDEMRTAEIPSRNFPNLIRKYSVSTRCSEVKKNNFSVHYLLRMPELDPARTKKFCLPSEFLTRIEPDLQPVAPQIGPQIDTITGWFKTILSARTSADSYFTTG